MSSSFRSVVSLFAPLALFALALSFVLFSSEGPKLPTSGATFTFKLTQVSVPSPQGQKTLSIPTGSIRWNDFVIEVEATKTGQVYGAMRRISDGKSYPISEREAAGIIMEFATMLDYFSDSEKWFKNGGRYQVPSGPPAGQEQKISFTE